MKCGRLAEYQLGYHCVRLSITIKPNLDSTS
jgi:hypothetical protein